jgi:hypothetical protein
MVAGMPGSAGEAGDCTSARAREGWMEAENPKRDHGE